MKRKILVIELFFYFFLLSCNVHKTNISQTALLTENKVIGGNIETKELNLARENCPIGVFSFCDGGYDDFFRSYPAFVQLDLENFISSYDKSVYLFPTPLILDTLKKRNEKFSLPWDLDSLFQNKSNDINTVKFYTSNKYLKKVKKEIKKNNLNIEFDGYFEYTLYKIKFKCVFGGKRILLIPNIKGNNSQGTMKDKICNVYYITEIIDIVPISKSDY